MQRYMGGCFEWVQIFELKGGIAYMLMSPGALRCDEGLKDRRSVVRLQKLQTLQMGGRNLEE